MKKPSPNIKSSPRDLAELDRIAKMLVRRDLQLTELREEREKELKELDQIAKLLIRRDLALSGMREKREHEFQQLQARTKELEESRKALLNILEDIEEARALAIDEKDKTMAIITNFTDGLMLFDSHNTLSLINPRAQGFFNAKQTLAGKSFSKLAQIRLLNPLIKVLKSNTDNILRKEIEVKKNLILEVNTVAVTKENERIGTLVILHDITRDKMIEKMKSEFVSLAAHQLRTPLSAIKWSLKMILDGDLGKLTKKQEEFLGKTYFSNERMIQLINDLLDITRIEEGKFLYRPVSTNIESIIQFVINSCRDQAKKRKIRLIFKCPQKKLPRIKVDVEKMRLAVHNLLDNSIRYTPQGGKVTISLKGGKKKIEILIKDTGIGISKEQQKRIFSKFFRGVNAVKMDTEGSGLGLYIVKNIIEAHNGTVWFESQKNRGTIFCLNIPISDASFVRKVK